MGIFNGNLFYLLLIPEGLILFRQAGSRAFNFREVLAPVIIGALALLALQRGGSSWSTFAVGLLLPALAAGVGGIISGIKARIKKRTSGIFDVSGGIWAVVMPPVVLLIWLAGEFAANSLSLSKSTAAAAILVFAVYLAAKGVITAFRISATGSKHQE